MIKVTAVLLRYKRPDELRAVIEDLKRYPFIDEILVKDNRFFNDIMFGRYLRARDARNEHIYVQDDDCIVESIEDLYNAYDGEALVNGMKPERAHSYRGADTLMGWGAFFRKDWLSTFDPYIERYGCDRLLKREADRIFTVLLSVPKHTRTAWIRDFTSAMAPYALSLQRCHIGTRYEALRRCSAILQSLISSRDRNMVLA